MRRIPAVVTVVCLALALSACSTPPWQDPSLNPSATGAPTTSSTASPSPSPSATAEVNDLAEGSTSRTLTAGDVTLTADYWSTLPLDGWTASATKPLSLALTGTLGTDAGQEAYLTAVTLVVDVDGGRLPAPDAQTDSSEESRGYAILSPYSYSGVFQIPSVDSSASTLTLTLTYELLVETEKGSGVYAKQSVVDALTIPLAAAG